MTKFATYAILAAAAAVATVTPRAAMAIDVNPLTAIKSAVEAAVEDRSAGDIGTDLKLKTKITADIIGKMGSDVIAIDVDVYEQNVMLTGSVETEAQKIQAGELTAGVDGVKKIYNEIMVVAPADKKKGAVENFIDDNVIETKINGLFLNASGVNVTNFRWRSVGGHVFLFGRALSQEENDKATEIARGIKDVVSVTNRAEVRPREVAKDDSGAPAKE